MSEPIHDVESVPKLYGNPGMLGFFMHAQAVSTRLSLSVPLESLGMRLRTEDDKIKYLRTTQQTCWFPSVALAYILNVLLSQMCSWPTCKLETKAWSQQLHQLSNGNTILNSISIPNLQANLPLISSPFSNCPIYLPLTLSATQLSQKGANNTLSPLNILKPFI